MNITLWILQFSLAILFVAFGYTKLVKSKDELRGVNTLHYVDDFSEKDLKLIGILEILGGLGLVLPQLTGIFPWLVTLASIGLVITMIVAMIVHLRRGDGLKALLINIVLLLIAAFITFGRLDFLV